MAIFGAKKRLGDMLIEAGIITEEQLQKALEEQKSRGTRLGETLMALNIISEEAFTDFMENERGFKTVSGEELKDYDPKALEIVGDALIKKHQVLPFGFDEDNINIIKVAMSEPDNLLVIDDVEMASGMEVEPFFTAQKNISIILDKIYGKASTMEAVEDFDVESLNSAVTELTKAVEAFDIDALNEAIDSLNTTIQPLKSFVQLFGKK